MENRVGKRASTSWGPEVADEAEENQIAINRPLSERRKTERKKERSIKEQSPPRLGISLIRASSQSKWLPVSLDKDLWPKD